MLQCAAPGSTCGSVRRGCVDSTLRCVGTTQRSKSRPLGTNAGATLGGHIMASRCAILLCVAFARGIFWVLEQPKGSLFQFHPSMQILFSLRKCFKRHLNMFDYGGESQKGTWLYSGRVCCKCRVCQKEVKPPTCPIKTTNARAFATDRPCLHRRAELLSASARCEKANEVFSDALQGLERPRPH